MSSVTEIFGAYPVIEGTVGVVVDAIAIKLDAGIAGGQIRYKGVVREKVVKRLASETVHGNICQRSGFSVCLCGVVIQSLNADILGEVVAGPDPTVQCCIKSIFTIKNVAADQRGDRKLPSLTAPNAAVADMIKAAARMLPIFSSLMLLLVNMICGH